MQICKNFIVVLFSLIGTILALALSGVLANLLGWTLFEAAKGDDVIAKHWILFGWTFVSIGLASIIRIFVLIRSRNYHRLRFLGYFKHAGISAVLAGGLAYGTVNLIISGMNASMDDVKTLGDLSDEDFLKLLWLALAPIFVTMMAAVITAHNNIMRIPHSN